MNMKKKFEELCAEELWMIREQITLNSLFIADYANSFGFNQKDVCAFFEGYVYYLYELCEEESGKEATLEEAFKLDSMDNLWSWFNCYDDLSWVKLEE